MTHTPYAWNAALVAVLDTGCDLTAAGLLTTSDGKPKYVDFIDCTGGGDIDTSKKASVDADGTVLGLSGRKLKLGEWADGVGEFRLGAFRLFDMLPSSVVRRVKAERKALFEAEQHATVTRVQRELDALAAGVGGGDADAAASKTELELQLKELKGLMDGYDDAGPLLDVLVFEGPSDGVLRAVVDVAAEGDVRDTTPMAPYRHARQVGDLGHASAVSFCVQIHDGGDIVSVVTDAGSHGTHVAGIVAANFEGGDGERDGVAPGAQILACKIGDGRLDSAETGTGLVRALLEAKKAGCELINLSYGEPFYSAEGGRVMEAFADATRKCVLAVRRIAITPPTAHAAAHAAAHPQPTTPHHTPPHPTTPHHTPASSLACVRMPSCTHACMHPHACARSPGGG